MSLFIQLIGIEVNQKSTNLAKAISDFNIGKKNENSSYLNIKLLKQIPTSPFVYWISSSLFLTFDKYKPFENENRFAALGLTTGDNFRFIRLWWEVNYESNKKQDNSNNHYNKLNGMWKYLAKGGSYSPYCGDIHLLLNWGDQGKEIKSFRDPQTKNPISTVRNENFYFRQGISFPRRPHKNGSFFVLPSTSIFADNGPSIFANQKDLLLLLAVTNSRLFTLLIEIRMGRGMGESNQTMTYEVGLINDTPLPSRINEFSEQLSKLAYSSYNIILHSYIEKETSPHFILPRIISDYDKEFSLTENIEKIKMKDDESITKYLLLQKTIDQIVMKSYRVSSSDISSTLSILDVNSDKQKTAISDLINKKSGKDLSKDLLSWIMGVLLGRWDIRIRNTKTKSSSYTDPFKALPHSSPGMFKNMLKSFDFPQDYPISFSLNGIVVDDEGHNQDIELRVRDVLNLVFKEKSVFIETDICQILDITSLRGFFQNQAQFFDDHYKQYSRSRRYAPIYWPLSTPSSSYTLWLYYHRIDDQILFTCVNDFVDPKLQQVTADIARLRSKRDRTRKEEDQLAELADFELELKDFRQELLRVAAFWKPNLNDGVEITAAPLWRLFQHRSWQKRLKTTWENLENGEYDWAHLAFSIWPERVKEKCKTDKSLAIAHDLDHLYQGDD